MEDISSLIWLGIAIVWFLAKLVRRGAKKAAASQKKQPRPTFSRPTAAPSESQQTRIEKPQSFTGRSGTGPPPIVPR
jgi:hypothetical protein